jgi:thiol-disulfide isomerase/thioredoxin
MTTPPAENPLWALTKVVAAAATVSAGILLYARYRPQEALNGLGPGAAAPAIAAQGWINGPAPAAEDLAGQVLVIDAWATWCGPCRDKAPELVALQKRYAGQGVVFIGLTDESPESLPAIEEFLSDTGITWANGFGAVETLDAFQHRGIPSIWVVGRDGVIVWNGDSSGDLEDAVERALQAKDPEPKASE